MWRTREKYSIENSIFIYKILHFLLYYAHFRQKCAAKFNFQHLHFPYFLSVIKLYPNFSRKDEVHAVS